MAKGSLLWAAYSSLDSQLLTKAVKVSTSCCNYTTKPKSKNLANLAVVKCQAVVAL